MPTNCLPPKGPKPLVAWVKVLWISQPTIPNHLLRWTFRIFELRPPVVPIIIAPPLVWDLNSTGVTSSGLAGLLHTHQIISQDSYWSVFMELLETETLTFVISEVKNIWILTKTQGNHCIQLTLNHVFFIGLRTINLDAFCEE